MSTEFSTDLQILLELEEVLDAPQDCEHSSHDDPSCAQHHDTNEAKWFLRGSCPFNCERDRTFLYVCDTFVSQGLAGAFTINCTNCARETTFAKYYEATKIKD